MKMLNFIALLQYILISHIYFTERKYSKLCELCESKRECSLNLHAHGNQEATLHCLTQGNGSVAYVENHYVQKYMYFRVSHLLFIFFITIVSLGIYFQQRWIKKIIEITVKDSTMKPF